MMKLLRFLFTILHIAIAVALLAMLLNAYIPPKTFGALNLLSLAFPALMILYFVLTLFWIFSWKKRAVFFIFVGLFFFNATIRWVNYNPKTEKIGQLKVVTFNANVGKYSEPETKKDTRIFLEEEDADIVFLQETELKDKRADFIQYPVVALKTKHKIIKHQKILDDGTNGHSFYTDIEINGKIIRAVNVYLEPYYMDKTMVKPSRNTDVNKSKLRNLITHLVPTFKIHQDQVEKIKRVVEESPYPVILAGDFNAVPNSWEYYNLVKGLKDAFVEVGSGSSTSFHDYKIPIRIDYIFASEGLKPVSYGVNRSVTTSDHFPVVATFDIEE